MTPDYYYDEDEDRFFDEDGDPVEIEPSDELVEAALAQRIAAMQAADEVWADQAANAIAAAEQHLGRRLTREEVDDFAAHMETHEGNPPPLDEDGYLEGNFYADLSDDESRRAFMHERLSEGAEEPYTSVPDQDGEVGGEAADAE
jgi:hypothetical protein